MNYPKSLNNIKTAIMLFLIFTILPVKAIGSPDVVINEIAWMGTENSYDDEWIELYNNSNHPINLEGWVLKAKDGSPEIFLSGQIPGFGFYLLERTDDKTLPGTTADQIYTGALSNKGETLQLFNDQNNLINEVDCGEGWFKGDNSTKQTMERRGPLSGIIQNEWQTSEKSGGTPKNVNSKPREARFPETESNVKKTETGIENGQNIIYPSNVIFNEILPSPEGPDAENEWIEIYNKNGFDVDLSHWKVKDSKGITKTYNFPEGTNIPGSGFLVLTRTETKITLNNDADLLKLIHPDNEVTDSVSYEKAPLGKSYSFLDLNWVWNKNTTPGEKNIVESDVEEKESKGFENNKNPLFSPEKGGGKLKASIIKNPEINIKPSNIFLMAFTVAALSGALILTIKRKIDPGGKIS